jgi:hypothetical protein
MLTRKRRGGVDMALQIRERLLRWALFGVIFAVLPILFNFLSAITRSPAEYRLQ